MARKTKEEAQITRSKLLDAARIMFYEKGVAATRLEDIAAEAGVTRGALYHHFDNKLSIFTAMHECTHCEMHSVFLTSMETATDPSRTFEDFCVDFLIDLETNEEMQRIFKILSLKCDYSGEMEAFLEVDNKKRENSLHTFEQSFKKMKAAGQINKDRDAKLAALSFFCYLTGIVTSYLRQPDLFNFRKQARPLIHQFLVSLKA